MESAEAAQARGAIDVAIVGVMSDGGLRRSEAAALTWGDVEFWADGTGRITIEKGKNQIEPLTVAVTETTARALREIQPNDADPTAPVFGLTGEALACRIRASARLPAWATVSPATAAASEWHGGWWRQGRPTRRCSARAGESTETWWPGTPGARRRGRR